MAMAIGLSPAITVAKPITTTDLLKNFIKGEPWDRGVLAATKMVLFQQNASGGTDATYDLSWQRHNEHTINCCNVKEYQ